MGFQIVKNRTFKKKVQFQMPNSEGGYDKAGFVGQFTLPSAEVVESFAPMKARDMAQIVFRSTDEIVNENKEPVPFTDELKEALLSDPIVAVAICAAFWEAINGGQLARKN